MTKLSKLGSLREQVLELRSERDRYQQALRRLVPGFKGGRPDGGWEALVRLFDHLAELRWMAEPTRAAAYGFASGSADSAVYPGVTLADDGADIDHPDGDGKSNVGSRELFHGGKPFEEQLQRVLSQLVRVVENSEAWMKGDPPPARSRDERVKVRRPRCRHCNAEMGLVWRYCANCGRPIHTQEEKAG